MKILFYYYDYLNITLFTKEFAHFIYYYTTFSIIFNLFNFFQQHIIKNFKKIVSSTTNFFVIQTIIWTQNIIYFNQTDIEKKIFFYIEKNLYGFYINVTSALFLFINAIIFINIFFFILRLNKILAYKLMYPH